MTESLIEQLKDAAHALPGFNDEMVRLSDAIAIVRQHDPHPTVWNWKNTNNGSLWGTPREHKPVSSAQQSLFKHGTFTSHSGLQLPDKIDCDALTDADWDAVSAWFASRLTFGQVVGIPQGGLALARALEKHVTTGPTLIVDDVLTTGRSMEEARKDHPGAIGAVLFSRTRNVPIWITARWVESDTADTRQPDDYSPLARAYKNGFDHGLLAAPKRESSVDLTTGVLALKKIAKAAESSSPDAHYLGNIARQALGMEPLPKKEPMP